MSEEILNTNTEVEENTTIPEAAETLIPKESEEAAEAKPEETKTEEVKPIEYEPFKAPEGMELDPDLTNELVDIAKESNLPQESAQKIVDLGMKFREKMIGEIVQAKEAESTKWYGEIKADPQLGGSNFSETLKTLKSGMQSLEKEMPGITQYINTTGQGNNPYLVKMIYKLSEKAKPFIEGQAEDSHKTLAELMFAGSMNN